MACYFGRSGFHLWVILNYQARSMEEETGVFGEKTPNAVLRCHKKSGQRQNLNPRPLTAVVTSWTHYTIGRFIDNEPLEFRSYVESWVRRHPLWGHASRSARRSRDWPWCKSVIGGWRSYSSGTCSRYIIISIQLFIYNRFIITLRDRRSIRKR